VLERLSEAESDGQIHRRRSLKRGKGAVLLRTVEPDAIYTREQAQELLQFSRATMSRLLTSGRLKGSKIGKDWRIWGRDVIALMESARQERAEGE